MSSFVYFGIQVRATPPQEATSCHMTVSCSPHLDIGWLGWYVQTEQTRDRLPLNRLLVLAFLSEDRACARVGCHHRYLDFSFFRAVNNPTVFVIFFNYFFVFPWNGINCHLGNKCPAKIWIRVPLYYWCCLLKPSFPHFSRAGVALSHSRIRIYQSEKGECILLRRDKDSLRRGQQCEPFKISGISMCSHKDPQNSTEVSPYQTPATLINPSTSYKKAETSEFHWCFQPAHASDLWPFLLVSSRRYRLWKRRLFLPASRPWAPLISSLAVFLSRPVSSARMASLPSAPCPVLPALLAHLDLSHQGPPPALLGRRFIENGALGEILLNYDRWSDIPRAIFFPWKSPPATPRNITEGSSEEPVGWVKLQRCSQVSCGASVTPALIAPVAAMKRECSGMWE